jgi:hypothetical protein
MTPEIRLDRIQPPDEAITWLQRITPAQSR